MSDSWYVVSCIVGEPTGPCRISGEHYWATAELAEQALETLCRRSGLDPDDFSVVDGELHPISGIIRILPEEPTLPIRGDGM